MKRISLIAIILFTALISSSQEPTAKEKAEAIARNEFSKTKHAKKEKYGIVKEKHSVIESSPVVTNDLAFYHGNYVYQDLDYKMEIRKGADGKLLATLSIQNGIAIILKNVTITDALFEAVKENADGSTETWEGVFIHKNDNGHIDFGLGLKLSVPVQLTQGLKITRIFLKKVSP